MGIINYIKQKPDGQKKFFALAMAVILTLIIVYFSFPDSLAGTRVAGEQREDKLSGISPFQAIKDEFSKAFAGFSEKMSELK